MKDINGNDHLTCPVCGVRHFMHWEDVHEITWDREVCQECAGWADVLYPYQLAEVRKERWERYNS